MRTCAILDIDGCCINIDARLPYLLSGDYKMFESLHHTDKEIPQGAFLYTCLLSNPAVCKCVFLTARPERTRAVTKAQLDKLFPNKKFDLVMRPEGNKEKDAEYKVNTLKRLGVDPQDVFLAVDDNTEICAAYRALGIVTYQTTEGW